MTSQGLSYFGSLSALESLCLCDCNCTEEGVSLRHLTTLTPPQETWLESVWFHHRYELQDPGAVDQPQGTQPNRLPWTDRFQFPCKRAMVHRAYVSDCGLVTDGVYKQQLMWNNMCMYTEIVAITMHQHWNMICGLSSCNFQSAGFVTKSQTLPSLWSLPSVEVHEDASSPRKVPWACLDGHCATDLWDYFCLS